MAMDGVEGEARAGWSHDAILSLFYADTSVGRAYGTIRVWLAEGGAERVTVPSGGTITSPGSLAGLRLPPGAGVTAVPAAGGRLAVRVEGLRPKVAPATARPAKRRPVAPGAGAAAPAPTAPTAPPALPAPTPMPPRPSPTPAPQPSATPATISAVVAEPVLITPQGQPALTAVAATGRRYRGTVELRRGAGSVRVINHVGLDDYVSGIAEERGAGWPLEGMKALAVAARSLGAATMTWLDTHHADGYDICSDDHCQVYFGYDGEEPVMRQATLETSGVIRTYDGRAILAMYHGNGGGQTASYKEVSGDASDAYPYLRSIKYPYADPWRWRVSTTLQDVADALSKAGTAGIPSPLKYVIVLERGESPRVQRVGLFGDGARGVAVSGIGFSQALGLPSNWFSVHLSHRPPKSVEAASLDMSGPGSGARRHRPDASFPWPLSVVAALLAVVAGASSVSMNGDLPTVARVATRVRGRAWRSRPRRAPGASPRRSRRRAAPPRAADASAPG